MTQNIKYKIDAAYKETFGSYMPISFNWLYDFCDFLEKVGYSADQMEMIISKLMAEENLKNMEESGFQRDNVSEKNENAFFAYLESIKIKITPEYLDAALAFAIENSKNSNLIDAFIKYVVSSNMADLNFKSNIASWATKGCGSISCNIGDFPLSKIGVVEVYDEENILFDNFYTRKNLTGMGLGSLVFKEFLQEIKRSFPNKNVFAGTVFKKNTGAINFYAKMGGEFYEQDAEAPILPSDIDDRMKENIIVLFSKEKIAKMLQAEDALKAEV